MDAWRDIDRPYALAEQIGPLVRRVLARNPSPFTYTGTQTYLVGDGADVAVIDPGPDDAEHLDVLIEAIGDDSPAKKAGLEKGDIILSFNDTEIKELRDLTRAVAETDPEAKAEVMVLHKGKEVTRTVTIGTLADQKA